MSLLIFTFQKHRIISQKSSLNFKIMQLQNKLIDMQKYAANISDGTVSMNDLMSCPANLFNRMSIFAQYSDMSANIGAKGQMMVAGGMGGLKLDPTYMQNQQMSDADKGKMQQQYEMMVFQQFKQQQLQKSAEAEKKLMDAEETKINQQIAQMETQLKMLDSEEQKVTDAEGKAAEKSAPQYMA